MARPTRAAASGSKPAVSDNAPNNQNSRPARNRRVSAVKTPIPAKKAMTKTKTPPASKSKKTRRSSIKSNASTQKRGRKKKHHAWCLVCRDSDEQDEMMLCDACLNAGHVECLGLKSSSGDRSFTCSECHELAEHEENETPEDRAERERSEAALAVREERMQGIHDASTTARKTTLLRMRDNLSPFISNATLKKETYGGLTVAQEASKKKKASKTNNGDGASGTAVLTGSLTVDQEENPEFFNANLRDYQVYGVEWLLKQYNMGIGGILADEMGLGKTVQTLAFISYLKMIKCIPGPFLIIVPLAVLHHWGTETARFAKSLTFCKIYGSKKEKALQMSRRKVLDGEYDVYLTTYETCVSLEYFFTQRFLWQAIIVDEGHRLKNEKGALSTTLGRIKASFRLLITGTPLQNNLHELWSLLNFLMPALFSDSSVFDEVSNLAGGVSTDQDEHVLANTHKLLKHFLLRRLKTDVMKDLQDKIKKDIFVPLSKLQTKLYRKILSKSKDVDNLLTSRQLMAKIMQLRKVCNHPRTLVHHRNREAIAREAGAKAGRVGTPIQNRSSYAEVDSDSGLSSDVGEEMHMPYIAPVQPDAKPTKAIDKELMALEGEDFINASGKLALVDRLLQRLIVDKSRVLIFSQFTQTLDVLEEYVKYRKFTYRRLDGSTNRIIRELDVRDFNAPGSNIFLYLISTTAGGQGLNLASADTVVLYDLNWNPHKDLQAEDRCHRIGQKKRVRVYRMITQGTVEERIHDRAQEKMLLRELVVSKHKDKKSGDEDEEDDDDEDESVKTPVRRGRGRPRKGAQSSTSTRARKGASSNGKGRADKSATKGSRKDVDRPRAKELRMMLQYGAERIFASKGVDRITEEDVDEILKESEEKVNLDARMRMERAIKRGQYYLLEEEEEEEEEEDGDDASVDEYEELDLDDDDDDDAEVDEKEKQSDGTLNENSEKQSVSDGDVVMGIDGSKGENNNKAKTYDSDATVTASERGGGHGIAKKKTVLDQPGAVAAVANGVDTAALGNGVAAAVAVGNGNGATGAVGDNPAAGVVVGKHGVLFDIKAAIAAASNTKSKKTAAFCDDDDDGEDVAYVETAAVSAATNSRPKRSGRARKSTTFFSPYQYDAPTRPKRDPIVHESFCFACDDGGSLIACQSCPKVYHSQCVGFAEDVVPKGAWTCPWHECIVCDKKSGQAGGIMFRCMHCPIAYCFDCLDAEGKVERAMPDPEMLADLKKRNFSTNTTVFIQCDECKEDTERRNIEKAKQREENERLEVERLEWQRKQTELAQQKADRVEEAKMDQARLRELFQMRHEDMRSGMVEPDELRAQELAAMTATYENDVSGHVVWMKDELARCEQEFRMRIASVADRILNEKRRADEVHIDGLLKSVRTAFGKLRYAEHVIDQNGLVPEPVDTEVQESNVSALVEAAMDAARTSIGGTGLLGGLIANVGAPADSAVINGSNGAVGNTVGANASATLAVQQVPAIQYPPGSSVCHAAMVTQGQSQAMVMGAPNPTAATASVVSSVPGVTCNGGGKRVCDTAATSSSNGQAAQVAKVPRVLGKSRYNVALAAAEAAKEVAQRPHFQKQNQQRQQQKQQQQQQQQLTQAHYVAAGLVNPFFSSSSYTGNAAAAGTSSGGGSVDVSTATAVSAAASLAAAASAAAAAAAQANMSAAASSSTPEQQQQHANAVPYYPHMQQTAAGENYSMQYQQQRQMSAVITNAQPTYAAYQSGYNQQYPQQQQQQYQQYDSALLQTLNSASAAVGLPLPPVGSPEFNQLLAIYQNGRGQPQVVAGAEEAADLSVEEQRM